MNNKEVFEKNNKANYVRNLNTSRANNEAKRLQEKVKSYKNQKKNQQNKNMANMSSSNGINNSNNDNTISRIKSAQNKKPQNSQVTNQVAKTGLQTAGVPAGVSDKIVNSKVGQKAIAGLKKKHPGLAALDALTGGSSKNEETTTGEGMQNFEIPKKVIKWMIIASPAVLTIVIFICLFVTASQIYLNAVTLGNADKLSASEAEEKITDLLENNSDKLDDKINDLGYGGIIYDEKSIFNSKFKESNLVEVANRKYNEADLSDLNDYYSGMSNYLNGEYDIDAVYNFFFKLMYIQKYYKNNYNVEIDLPLLMATLRVGSSDMGKVFSQNIVDYDVSLKDNNPLFAHDYDWSGYITSKTTSKHDIEVLVQKMVTKTESGTYKVDQDAYREFLKEFLEKKYFVNNGESQVGELGINGNKYNSNTTTESIKDGNYVSNVTYTNSNFGEVVYFNQGDYSKYYYSSDPSKPQFGKSVTIKSHGCGPTALSIVASSLLNKTIDPIQTTSKVCSLGGCSSTGSTVDGIIKAAESYGLKVTLTNKNQEVINYLNSGKSLVIVLMGPGTFTTGGHYIVLTGSNTSGQVSVSDPGSRRITQQKWFSFNTVVEQKKKASYMIFSR